MKIKQFLKHAIGEKRLLFLNKKIAFSAIGRKTDVP